MRFNKPFTPPIFLRHPMLQTLFSSSFLRKPGKNPMHELAEETIITVDDHVRLQGFYSKNPSKPDLGMVILIHGWEGNHNSAYILDTGKTLFEQGYNIFRLNLRDHGESHHLNQGLFLGTLIDETFQAVQAIANMFHGRPVFIVGFSMGGNFAIRVAGRCSATPIPNLKQVVAINPPMDPLKATVNIDNNKIIKNYFLKKWKRSLMKKQLLYPDAYDFKDIMNMNSCMAMTAALLEQYSPYRNYGDYFSRYTLTNGYLDAIEVPTWILMSRDDPIIPVEDFILAKKNEYTTITIHERGGHCGYLTNIHLTSWYQDKLPILFNHSTFTTKVNQ